MKLKSILFSSLLAVVVPFAAVAQAQQASPIQLKLKAEKEVKMTNADGITVRSVVPADKVLPGETVVYTITYLNSGAKDASDVVIHNPIPKEMIYLDGSAEGDGTEIQFSVDGGKTYKPAGELTTALADGTSRPAEPREYNAIRWTLLRPMRSR